MEEDFSFEARRAHYKSLLARRNALQREIAGMDAVLQDDSEKINALIKYGGGFDSYQTLRNHGQHLSQRSDAKLALDKLNIDILVERHFLDYDVIPDPAPQTPEPEPSPEYVAPAKEPITPPAPINVNELLDFVNKFNAKKEKQESRQYKFDLSQFIKPTPEKTHSVDISDILHPKKEAQMPKYNLMTSFTEPPLKFGYEKPEPKKPLFKPLPAYETDPRSVVARLKLEDALSRFRARSDFAELATRNPLDRVPVRPSDIVPRTLLCMLSSIDYSSPYGTLNALRASDALDRLNAQLDFQSRL